MIEFEAEAEAESGGGHQGDISIRDHAETVLKPHSLLFPDDFDFDFDFGDEDSFQLIIGGHPISVNLNLLLALSVVKTTNHGILCVFPDHLLPILQFNRLIYHDVRMNLKIKRAGMAGMAGVKYKFRCAVVPDPAQDIPIAEPYRYPLYSYERIHRFIYLVRLYRLYIITPPNSRPIISLGINRTDIKLSLESKATRGIYHASKETRNVVRQSIGHRLPAELIDMILGFIHVKSWTLYTYSISPLDRNQFMGMGDFDLDLDFNPGPTPDFDFDFDFKRSIHALHLNSFEVSGLGGGLRYVL
jgi:hypothetical protein